MSKLLLTIKPNSKLKINLTGEYSGLNITGGYLAPVTSLGIRWINVFYRRRGRGGKGVDAMVLANGDFQTDECCADEDVEMYRAAYDAATEQYGGATP